MPIQGKTNTAGKTKTAKKATKTTVPMIQYLISADHKMVTRRNPRTLFLTKMQVAEPTGTHTLQVWDKKTQDFELVDFSFVKTI